MLNQRWRWSGLLAIVTMATMALTALLLSNTFVGAAPPEPVELQFLSVSDWHGQLDPLAG